MKGPQYLADYAQGHNNNFNLMRFVAASLVLMSHSFILATGIRDSEPLRSTLGVTWGSIAVDVFFVTSGFLVTGSLLYRKSLKEFLAARVLRIFPALWVSLILTVLMIGWFVTDLDMRGYFGNLHTWKFLSRNALLVLGLDWNLPGAFASNPSGGAVNGSLWSLPAEINMYLVLASGWLVLKAVKSDAARWLSVACVAFCLLCLGITLTFYRDGAQSGFFYLAAMFFSGAMLRVLQARIRMVHCVALGALLLVVVLAAMDRSAFGLVYRLALPYVVLYLATVPGGVIRKFNALGDYSYGLYIYAFPVQQAIAHFWTGVDPYQMMATSFGLTLLLAIGSWHGIEKRALSLKEKLR